MRLGLSLSLFKPISVLLLLQSYSMSKSIDVMILLGPIPFLCSLSQPYISTLTLIAHAHCYPSLLPLTDPLPNGTTLPCDVIMASPCPLADNQTPGNVTRDRLAAIVSGNEQDPL